MVVSDAGIWGGRKAMLARGRALAPMVDSYLSMVPVDGVVSGQSRRFSGWMIWRNWDWEMRWRSRKSRRSHDEIR